MIPVTNTYAVMITTNHNNPKMIGKIHLDQVNEVIYTKRLCH